MRKGEREGRRESERERQREMKGKETERKRGSRGGRTKREREQADVPRGPCGTAPCSQGANSHSKPTQTGVNSCEF